MSINTYSKSCIHCDVTVVFEKTQSDAFKARREVCLMKHLKLKMDGNLCVWLFWLTQMFLLRFFSAIRISKSIYCTIIANIICNTTVTFTVKTTKHFPTHFCTYFVLKAVLLIRFCLRNIRQRLMLLFNFADELSSGVKKTNCMCNLHCETYPRA